MKIQGFSSNLFGWYARNELDGVDRSLEEILYDCSAAGLDAVEIEPFQENLKLLKANQLQLSSSYYGALFHEPWESLNAEQNILPLAQQLKDAGGRDLIVNADPKGGWGSPLPKTEDELKRQGETLARLGDLLHSLDVRLCFHNHADTKEMAEGDLRSVIDYASPLVGLCIDTGWAHAAGCDPIEWIEKYPERVFSFHLRNQRGKVPTENVWDGEIDMVRLVNSLEDIRYNGWLTFELWHRPDNFPQKSMVTDVKESVMYLKNLIPLSRNSTL